MSFLSFKRSPSKRQEQDEVYRKAEEERKKQEMEEEEKKQKREAIMSSYMQQRPPESQPPRARLNPKLTRRGAPPGYDDLPLDENKPKIAAKLTHDGKY